jgi:F-type H+-transporting ATPase subunit b
MPQLDITNYISQIFWLGVCFLILYIFVSYIILPRIAAILQKRKNIINADLALASELDAKINAIQIEIEILRKDASQKYQLKIEQEAKENAKKREIMLEEMKIKIDRITQKSRQDLNNFIEESEAKSHDITRELVQKIKEKLFGKELISTFKE